MPDITMCIDSSCIMKEYCYRFKATPNKRWQSYFAKSPRNEEGCFFFWPTEESKEYEDRSGYRNNDESQEDSRSGN